MAPADEARQAIQILSLEYQALRADIVHRSSVRFGMLTVGLGIIALFAPLTQANGIMPNWVAVGIILAYLAILSAAWLNAGKSIGILSNQLVVLERRINELAGQPLLSWEMRQQRRRGRLGRRLFGRPLPDQDYGE